MSRLCFCDDVCRALYHRSAKRNIYLQRFALLSSAQGRCGFCGEQMKIKKLVMIV